MVDAVVFDLFGTLVPAPTPRERFHASARLAAAVGCRATTVESYLLDTWSLRHDGTLPTVTDLAGHLVRAVKGSDAVVSQVADELCALGRVRLTPALSILHTLKSLRDMGLQLGVLSDASAEIATCWPTSSLSNRVDAAMFSCQAGIIKPDQRLYERIRDELEVESWRTLYVGDGGGDELHGALAAGMTAVAVGRRGPDDALAFGAGDWSGHVLDAVEQVPAYLEELK